MRYLLIVAFFPALSCSKLPYLYHQAKGQWGLLWEARPNKEVLQDPKVPEKVKRKISFIQNLKDHFYSYWEEKPTKIYSKTTILKEKAVTHLLTSSSYREIKANRECFPFMGCFPYIGFFKKKHALTWAAQKEKQGHYTFVRPVYAYSTLGYFNDPILSSFFEYNDRGLSELIFHELFHTIFFLRDRVKLNENLANYFAEKMANEYWGEEKPEDSSKKLRQELVRLTNDYQKSLQQSPPTSRKEANERLQAFREKTLIPHFKKLCSLKKDPSCFPLKRNWNHASLSAYLVYEDYLDKIEKVHSSRKESLKDFFSYLKACGDDLNDSLECERP